MTPFEAKDTGRIAPFAQPRPELFCVCIAVALKVSPRKHTLIKVELCSHICSEPRPCLHIVSEDAQSSKPRSTTSLDCKIQQPCRYGPSHWSASRCHRQAAAHQNHPLHVNESREVTIAFLDGPTPWYAGHFICIGCSAHIAIRLSTIFSQRYSGRGIRVSVGVLHRHVTLNPTAGNIDTPSCLPFGTTKHTSSIHEA